MTSEKILAIALMFFLPFISVLIPILLGQRYGQYRKKKTEEAQHAPVGSVVGAAFGLLAFYAGYYISNCRQSL